MNKPKVAFFGTPEESIIIAQALFDAGYKFACVVTKSPRPVGRKQIITPTPLAIWAQKNHLPLLMPKSNQTKPWLFADESTVISEVLRCEPDILITADYTQKIPVQLISKTKYGGLNVHPSILPAYRGPAPVPWAILNGEIETGVSIVMLAEKFDQGRVITQEKELIQPTDTTPILLNRLFEKGAKLLINIIPSYCHPKLARLAESKRVSGSPYIYKTKEMLKSPPSSKSYDWRDPAAAGQVQRDKNRIQPSYFPRLTRETGFEDWNNIKAAIESGKDAPRIERKYRALHPWPGLWTKVKFAVSSGQWAEKRLKILKLNLQPTTNNLQLLEVQWEGKKPISGKLLESMMLNQVKK